MTKQNQEAELNEFLHCYVEKFAANLKCPLNKAIDNIEKRRHIYDLWEIFHSCAMKEFNSINTKQNVQNPT